MTQPADRMTYVVDNDLTPQGLLVACPSSTVAVLGVVRPVQVWCGGLLGHGGDHEFRITWTSPAEQD